jgi:hypothetical protein
VVKSIEDNGLFELHTRAKTIEFRNTSPLEVSDLRGHITWYKSEPPSEMGTVPFLASGSVYAGESAVLEVQSNKLPGTGIRADVVIDSVHVRN